MLFKSLNFCRYLFRSTPNLGVSLALLLCSPFIARSQAAPTATRGLVLSAFAGPTGTYTGLQGSRNIAITAGVDLNFAPFHGFYPSLEVRGTYPVLRGVLDDQRNVLGGLKLSRTYGIIHPYADLLAGRGQINYHGGYPGPAPGLFYLQTASNVISPGAGVAVDVGGPFRIIADAQVPRYATPVTPSGHIFAKAFTLGVEYRLR